MRYFDFHTHHHRKDSIINCSPKYFAPQENFIYSVGIHPWYLNTYTEAEWLKLELIAQNPQIVAIGEAGLDQLIETPLEIQLEAFTRQKNLAERHNIPLIVHLVKYNAVFFHWLQKEKPQIPIIIHGFRGKPEWAQQLLKAGCYLSIGKHYNPSTVEIIPLHRLLLETDESDIDLKTQYSTIAQLKNIAIDSLVQQMEENYNNLF